MMDEKQKKSRAWNAILYPESLPDNWQEILDETHLQWCMSPLHDKDINATGETKKPHYHVTVVWDGPTTYKAAKELFHDVLNGAVPQPCHSLRGSVRYMAHLDNPEKYQYSINDIIGHGGIDMDELLKPSEAYQQELLGRMTDWIIDNRCDNFAMFMLFCREEHPEWFEIATRRNTGYIRALIDGVYQVELRRGNMK